jgi:Arc/MetJ-type ribon-helix-helix transcriptional regulator
MVRKTRTITLKIPEPLAARLRVTVRKRGSTQSAVVREALEAHLDQGAASGVGSGLDLVRDLVGCITGPSDLSTNRKHLRGYGRR